MPTSLDELRALQNENERLRKDKAALREAIQPFAAMEREIGDSERDERYTGCSIRLGDLRRAAQVLKDTE